MGLYIGNQQVDMFSLLHHSNDSIKAVKNLPSTNTLTISDVGKTYVIIPGDSSSSYIVGHIYSVISENSQLKYRDLNSNGGGISAFYDANTNTISV